MENENAFKNWINPAVVKKTAMVFHDVYPAFDVKRFAKISTQLKELELKGRVLLITKALKQELPQDYHKSAKLLRAALDKNKLTGFELWPLSEYISQFGHDHLDESLDLMYHLTQQFTSEFAIRPFLQKNPGKVLEKLETWLGDESSHVRRWISEGTRPILPWGGKIPSFIESPATLHLLEALKYDEELYVRKSIANHLNDITKHHPKLVVTTLKKWVKDAPAEHAEKIAWIKRHALRTLIKKGDAGALGLMGVSSGADVEISKFKLSKKTYKVGETLEFSFQLKSVGKKSQKLIVDYGIGFRKANGGLSTKIFKLKGFELPAGESLSITKRHPLKLITTTKFYSGEHEIFVQVNGVIQKKLKWVFKV